MTCTPDRVSVRAARIGDISEITEIHGYYVSHTPISFEIEPTSILAMARRFEDIVAANAPYLVAECDGRVIGFAYARPYKARAVYQHTIEHSAYLAHSATERGVGRLLLDRLIEACVAAGFMEMVATIAGDDNHASMRLHVQCGFIFVGKLKNVGLKNGCWLDVTLLQRSLRRPHA